MKPAVALVLQLGSRLRDLLPVMAVVAFFQLAVIGRPLPEGMALGELWLGVVLALSGLTLFIHGLEVGLFALGESLAR